MWGMQQHGLKKLSLRRLYVRSLFLMRKLGCTGLAVPVTGRFSKCRRPRNAAVIHRHPLRLYPLSPHRASCSKQEVY